MIKKSILKQNLTQRILSAIIFIPVFIYLLTSNEWTFFGLISLIALLILTEFYKMTIKTHKVFVGLFISLSFIIQLCYFASLYSNINYVSLETIYILLFTITFFSSIFISPVKTSLQILSYAVFGLIYCLVPFIFIYKIAFLKGKFQYNYILGLIIMIWSIDSGAYFFGKFLGKHKFFPTISPNKTWEGVLGGVLSSFLVGFILYNSGILNIKHWYIVSCFISFSSIIGDLLASLFKRSSNIKDSGNFIPGHGGFIDRFDSFIFSAPLYYLILTFLNQLHLD